MSDYNTIRLRQIARIKLMQGKELTADEEFALTDYVPSKLNDEDNQRRKYNFKNKVIKPRKLDGKEHIVDQMFADGNSMPTIAKALGVSTTNIRENLLRRGKI